ILTARRSIGAGRPSVSSQTKPRRESNLRHALNSKRTEEKMEAQARSLHPLVAGAAVAVIVAGGVAVAAITGYLPGSKAEIAPEKAIVSHPAKPVQPKQHGAAAFHDCRRIVEGKAVDVPGKGTGIGAVAGGVGGAEVGPQL